MKVNSLTIKNFRNLQSTTLNPGNFLNVFLGGNAQGKTSVLEAIFFASHLKSFRTKTYKDLVKFSFEESQLGMDFENEGIKYESVVRFGESRNKLLLNGKAISKKTYSGKINAVAFSPDSLSAIKQGPSTRRELLDSVAAMIFKEAAESQYHYEKTIKQKNACLKSMRSGEISLSQGRSVVESLNQVLIPLSADVLFMRHKVIQDISPIMRKILKEITQKTFDFEIIAQTKEKTWPTTSIETRYEEIKERVKREILDPTTRVIEEQTGYSIGGAHRHEITFLVDGKDARVFCSQGQQRALILAFKMAEIVYHSEALGTQPLLLLDDVLSEFDEDKQKYLLDFLQKNEAQTFLTATHTTGLLKDAKVFHLNAGTVKIHD